jgi:hypothetical protein
MSDVKVNSVRPSDISEEMVALYLLALIAKNEADAVVNFYDGIPIISGKNKSWILTNYADCIRTIIRRQVAINSNS